jgi:hypothetical protein
VTWSLAFLCLSSAGVGAALVHLYYACRINPLVFLAPKEVERVLEASGLSVVQPEEHAREDAEVSGKCAVCDEQTHDYRACWGPNGEKLNAMFPVCREHNVRLESVGVMQTEEGLLPTVEPYVDEEGDPAQAFAYRVIDLDEEAN